MNGRFQKQLSPRAAAALILAVLILVQWVWWRGLVYRPLVKSGGGGGGGGRPPATHTEYFGREDVRVETYAGVLEPGAVDGLGYTARFDRPTGIALDAQGNVYVADTGNQRIRRITPDGRTTTFAGGREGFADGPALQARFKAPCGVSAAPDGSVYVADTGNHCIRRIQNGQVTTVAGKSTAAGSVSGAAPPMSLPCALAYVPGPMPSLLAADTGNRGLRQYRLDGLMERKQDLAGPPTAVVALPLQAAALPQAGTILLSAQTLQNMPIEAEESLAEAERRVLSLRHPVGICPLGNGWLVTDNDHGAVFHILKGKVEVLAGVSSSTGPRRGWEDGDGVHARFNNLCGIVTDGKRYIYTADTANNMIYRITLPPSFGH